ncbi:hypothetical protein CSB37_03040 [bacterium DOLZORAL124_38_8]|nr:MAG: hypothetical protein CSB37_03040 [bacterium DOLZORAL124_38_8]
MNTKTNTKHIEKNRQQAVEQIDGLTKDVFGKNPPKKMIDKAIEKTGIKSETISDAIDLKKEVQAKAEKSWIGKATTMALSGLAMITGREIFRNKEKKLLGKTVAGATEVYFNEKTLKKTLDTTEKLEADKKRLEKKVNKIRQQHADKIRLKNPNLKPKEALKAADKKIDELQNSYGGKKKGILNVFSNSWEKTATDQQGNKRSWWGRAWAFLPAFMSEFKRFFLTKKLEKSGFFAARVAAKQKGAELEKRGKEIKGELDAVKNDAKKFGKSAKERLGQVKTIKNASKRSGVLPALKLLKANNKVATQYTKSMETLINALEKGKISPQEFAKSLSGEYQKSFNSLLRDLKTGKIKPEKFANLSEALLKDTQTMAGKNGKVQTEFLKLVKKGKVPGMKINSSVGKLSKIPVGAIGVASAINISIIEAIQAGSFTRFFDSLTSTETLTEAFIPGVGTWNSIKRIQNTDNPTWLKAVDVGINVVGDVALAAGYVGAIFSFGSSAGLGVAARTGVSAIGKRFISRQTLRFAGQAAKQGIKKGVRSSVMMSPISVGLALLAKKLKGKKVEKSATNFYMENVETEQQKRARNMIQRWKKEHEEKKSETYSQAA